MVKALVLLCHPSSGCGWRVVCDGRKERRSFACLLPTTMARSFCCCWGLLPSYQSHASHLNACGSLGFLRSGDRGPHPSSSVVSAGVLSLFLVSPPRLALPRSSRSSRSSNGLSDCRNYRALCREGLSCFG